MSVIHQDGRKTLLPRADADLFWETVRRRYAGADRIAWRRLAILSLREQAGWPLELLAFTFGRNKGDICRGIGDTKRELRRRFRPTPGELSRDAEEGE